MDYLAEKILPANIFWDHTGTFIRATNMPVRTIRSTGRIVRLPAKEPDWKKKGVKEAIFTRKAGTRYQLGWGAPPSSRSLIEVVVPRDLVSWHIFVALIKVPVWSRNILAGKIFLTNNSYPK